MFSFAVQKLLSLIKSHLFIFVFIFITLGDGSKKILLRFMSESVLPVFSSKSFIVSSLTFRSLIHFEFIFAYGVGDCSNFKERHHYLLAQNNTARKTKTIVLAKETAESFQRVLESEKKVQHGQVL